jgi:single-stranded-DNA-specific exonuclease
LKLLSEISTLEPFGVGNPAPIFRFKGVYVLKADIVGSKHIKVMFTPQRESFGSNPLPAIAFNAVGSDFEQILLSKKPLNLSVFGTLKLNSWQGYDTTQLQLRDIIVE